MTEAAASDIRKPVAPKAWAALFFAVVSIAVWTPSLFQNGYVLLGDMVFTPAMHSPVSMLGPVRGTMDVALIYNLAWLVSRVIGAVLLQKAVLLLIAFLPGYLMYRNVPATRQWSRLFAGTLYAINPFVYTRMVMGQWGFLLGYALLPVVFASTIKTVRRPSARRCATTALWLAGTAVLSLHAGALALLITVVTAVFELARMRGRARRALAAGVAVLLLFALLSGFWLVPALNGGGPANAIGRADLKAFETSSTSRAGVAVSVIGLYGYWKTQIDALMPRRYVPAWPLFGLLGLALCVLGLIRYWSEPGRGPGLGALAALGLLGFFLALGARAPVTGSLFATLFDHFTPFRVFREPQKFVALMVLAYSMLGASGLDRILSRRSLSMRPSAAARRVRTVTCVILVALVCLYSFRMFGSLWGQAKAVAYPRSWAEAQAVLERDTGDWSALYLPPFWYMRFDFTGSAYTITNPMPLYFKNRSVPLRSIEVGGRKLDQQALDSYVQASLDSARDHGNLGAMLAPLDVKYVLMPLNEAGRLFTFVEHQADLEVVRRWGDLVLLQNRVPVSRLTLTQTTGSFQTWSALGEQARGGALVGSYLPRGRTTSIPQARGRAIPHRWSSSNTVEASLTPVEEQTLGNDSTVLFSEPYSENWRAEGACDATPLQHLGVVTAFRAASGAATSRLRIYYLDVPLLIGYSLSGVALLLCAVFIVAGAARARSSKRPV